MSEAGHKFFSKTGEKRYAQVGNATDWLIAEGWFSKEKRDTDLGNRAIYSNWVAQRFGCKITAVDMDAQAFRSG